MNTPHWQNEHVTLYHGDCLDVLRQLPDNSVDSVVTDPPYGLEFMGREWDGADGFRRSLNTADTGRDSVFGRTSRTSPEYRAGHLFEEWCEQWAAECLRVLKPGGHLLAFGGSRTWHRLAAGVEDAGFEIRDSIAWLYGSGFPKSLDVSKAIDAAAGAAREKVPATGGLHSNRVLNDDGWSKIGAAAPVMDGPSPVTDAAKAWEGWGTALKPAFEPIVVGRKPLTGTVASNVLAYGTGALNIGATRVAHGDDVDLAREQRQSSDTAGFGGGGMKAGHVQPLYAEGGRWPANVVLDESQAAELDRQSGTSSSTRIEKPAAATPDDRVAYGAMGGARPARGFTDAGGASRFFPTFPMPTFRYEAKAPTSERPKAGEVQHPTVKPLDLMRWLVRLVTPPGGVVLEPFAGSGTTVEAAVLEGFQCIAIEREADYLPLIEQRLSKPMQQSLFDDLLGGDAA